MNVDVLGQLVTGPESLLQYCDPSTGACVRYPVSCDPDALSPICQQALVAKLKKRTVQDASMGRSRPSAPAKPNYGTKIAAKRHEKRERLDLRERRLRRQADPQHDPDPTRSPPGLQPPVARPGANPVAVCQAARVAQVFGLADSGELAVVGAGQGGATALPDTCPCPTLSTSQAESVFPEARIFVQPEEADNSFSNGTVLLHFDINNPATCNDTGRNNQER